MVKKFRFPPALLCWLLISLHVEARSVPEFTKLVQDSAAAVVNITATRANHSSYPEHYRQQRELPDLFRRFLEELPNQRIPRPAAGSGFVISRDGYILTNHHVVAGADEIIVALSDRREREAELIGADPLSDLALLKIAVNDLPTVELGSSEDLQVGEWVVAIGSPFGFELSVTAGIVSAKGRSLPHENGNYIPFIQTDVAINPGNSGGPLFDLSGKVVGINSQIFTRSGGFMGLSFAIPIDVAMEVVAQLKEHGEVSRGWLGVLVQRVDRDLAESFGLDRATGALISQVFADSPAEKSGLKEGDIILEFNGRKIDLSSALPHMVGRTPADSEVKIKIVRDGKRQTLNLKVGLLPDQDRLTLRTGSIHLNNRLGLEVRELTPKIKDQYRIDNGVIVGRVSRGPAADAGIRQGDVITDLDGEAITSVQQFGQKVRELPSGRAISIRVLRGGVPEFLVIKIIAQR